MKARVKATGDIFEISDTTTIYPEHYNKSYNITEVEFLDVKENAFPKDDTPDYWEKLKHQYAGMAMQGMISNEYTHKLYLDNKNYPNGLLNDSIKIATALVEKLKEGK